MNHVHAPVKVAGIEEAAFYPTLVALLLCWSVVIAASETGVSTKTGVREVGPHEPELVSMGQ